MKEAWAEGLQGCETNSTKTIVSFSFFNKEVGSISIYLDKREVVKALSPLIKKAIFEEDSDISVYRKT